MRRWKLSSDVFYETQLCVYKYGTFERRKARDKCELNVTDENEFASALKIRAAHTYLVIEVKLSVHKIQTYNK